MKEWKVPCEHQRPRRGLVYDYCPDCHAMRKHHAKTTGRPDDWHSCDLCRSSEVPPEHRGKQR